MKIPDRLIKKLAAIPPQTLAHGGLEARVGVAGKPAQPARAKRKFAAGEFVRIVPLHHPQLAAAASHAHLTYRGGALLQAVKVFTVFWGNRWSRDANARALIARLNQFYADMLASPMIDQLGEYSVAGKPIGHGAFIGTRTITPAAPVDSVTDSELRGALGGWIKAHIVPKNTRNTLYMVYLDPGVASIMGGSRSCQNFCGYHDRQGLVYYGVIPYPTCAGCLGGMDVFDALTATSSHELSEAITDPVPGKGWYDDSAGEVGDVCAWSFKQVGGYTVQKEWSNQRGKCV